MSSPLPNLASQLASLVAANGSGNPGRLSAPQMTGRSKSAPQSLGGSHQTGRGVASTFGGYVAALAGSISNTFTSPNFTTYISSPASSPQLDYSTSDGLNTYGRTQGAKRKSSSQTPGCSPSTPSMPLPDLSNGHVDEPRRDLMEEEGYQGVLLPVTSPAFHDGISTCPEVAMSLADGPTSVPMAMADSRDSVGGSPSENIRTFVRRNELGIGQRKLSGSSMYKVGHHAGSFYTSLPDQHSQSSPNGTPRLNGTYAAPHLDRSSSLRTPFARSVLGGPPHATDANQTQPQTPPPENDDAPPVVKTSQSHPMKCVLPPDLADNCIEANSQVSRLSISPVLPPELLAAFGESLLSGQDDVFHRDGPLPAKVDMFDLTGQNSAAARSLLPRVRLPITPPKNDAANHVTDSPPHGSRVNLLGNLLLSSCPGKKIRLSNNITPEQRLANGNRSAICRDLRSDFRRATERGVKAVICCIDDAELAFLGSPWNEYYAAATEAGLVVYRLAMAEGYAPEGGVAEMDALLDVVIEDWTAKGQDVLCHCRGGVGRAGLVACCWLIRCGLVRTSLGTGGLVKNGFSSEGQANGHLPPAPPPSTGSRIPDVRYLRNVERVIEVVRRRRSCVPMLRSCPTECS